jgi:hypothetical protein
VVVPPAALDDDGAVSWTLSTLLAVRRVVGPRFAGEVVVEARHAEAREMLLLAAEPGVAGPGALAMHVTASDEVVARVLAQSARQDGVYFALREMLSFAGSELFLEHTPDALVGMRFDEAHAAVRGAVLLGVRYASGRTVLDPPLDDPRTLARGDRLIVLAGNSRRYRVDGALPTVTLPRSAASTPPSPPERVTIVGFNRTLPYLVRELDKILAPRSEVRLLCAGREAETRAQIDGVASALVRVAPVLDPRRTMEVALACDDALLGADAVVILGCQDEADENGDASALAALLWLRHGMRRAPRRIRRVVTEVRDPRSAGHVTGSANDFLVSSDVVAMLLAQCALEPDVAPVYRELLSPEGAEVFVRAASRYVGERGGTWADVMAAARLYGEVAIGLLPTGVARSKRATRSRIEEGETAEDDAQPVKLNPPRETEVSHEDGTMVVVIALSGLPLTDAEA